MALLQVINISKTIGQKTLLRHISLAADRTGIVALLGPNGAGKTTLLKTIIGLHQAPPAEEVPQKNIISFDGQLINTWSLYKRIEAGLIYLPQHSALFKQLTVQDNLEAVYHYHPFWTDQPFKTFHEEMTYWLEQTTLTSMIGQKAGLLSGGQKRKLEIVRSLLMRPKMLLLDEPFAGVDPKSIYELKKIFSLLSDQQIGIIISDHHVEQLLSIAQQVYVIMNGEVVTSGSIQDILNDSLTKEHYLGNQFYGEIIEKFLS